MAGCYKMEHSDIIRNLYTSYYRDKSPSSARFMFSHWKHESRAFNVDIENNIFEGGGGFGLKHLRLYEKPFTWLCIFSYLTWLPHRTGIVHLMLYGLRITRTMGLPFTWDCFRQLCSLELIRRHARKLRNILIIGDGFGFLGSLVKVIYPDSRIVLVDLGATSIFQAYYCMKAHPTSRHAIAGKGDADIYYCPVESINDLHLRYDCIINICSMQEMTTETINLYFNYFRRSCTENNIFYCCNRASKTLSGGEVIEFDKYPWDELDDHMIDEEPPFYKYFISHKLPFVHHLDGKMRHRLSRLALFKNN